MATRPPNGPTDPHDPRQPYEPPRIRPGHPQQPPPQWQGATGPPPRLPRKRSRTTLIVLSILGVCALLFVGCVALVIAGAPDPDPDPDTGGGGVAPDEQTTATDVTPEPKTAKPGESARDGQFEFTVGRVSQHQVWGPEFAEVRAQGVFWVIGVTVANVGDEPRTFEAGWQVAYDAKGRKYEASTAAMTADQDTSFLNNINPGNSVRGRVVFDVPKGTKLARVELHDSAFSGGVEVRLA